MYEPIQESIPQVASLTNICMIQKLFAMYLLLFMQSIVSLLFKMKCAVLIKCPDNYANDLICNLLRKSKR